MLTPARITESIPVLRQVSRPLTADEIAARGPLVREMEGLLAASGGVGLAAIQVGTAERFFIVSAPFKDSCFNPEVLKSSSETETDTEGCLSLAGGKELYRVARAASITVRYTDATGTEVVRDLEGFAARVFQHENDHLDGRLICDHGKRAPR